MVAARDGLERDQGGVVLEQHRNVAGSLDLRLAGTTHNPFPAEAGAVEPVSKCTVPRLEHVVG